MFNQNASVARRLRPVVIVAMLAVAAGTATQRAHAAVGFPQASSVRVSLSGIDLTNAAGQQMAAERLAQAARLSCLRIEDELDLARHADYLACVNAALTQSMPKLAELISRRSAVQLAGNTSY